MRLRKYSDVVMPCRLARSFKRSRSVSVARIAMSLLDLIDDRDGRPRFVVFVLVAMLVVGCCIGCCDFEYHRHPPKMQLVSAGHKAESDAENHCGRAQTCFTPCLELIVQGHSVFHHRVMVFIQDKLWDIQDKT